MKQRGRGTSKGHRPASLAALRVFAPLLGLWGAALGAGAVAVLPNSLVETTLQGTLLATMPLGAQPLLAAFAATLLGTVLFIPAAAIHARARVQKGGLSVAEIAVRRIQPINPARDLGTGSLDDPLDDMPFASPAWRDADLDAGSPEPEAEAEAAPEHPELDLTGFAELSDPDAGPVEAAPAASSPEREPSSPETVLETRSHVLRAVPPSPAPVPGTAALARLRAVPPSELSLAEMVERFAGALHQHRTSPPVAALGPTELAGREAALAEALKALAALSAEGGSETQASAGEEPLRAALARLQRQRGVA